MNNNLFIYSFNSFDDYCEFCEYIHKFIIKNTSLKLNNSSLYLYNSKYYLCININETKSEFLKSLHYSLIEFGKFVDSPELFERKLIEYGDPVFKKNAIQECIKYFK